MKISTAGPVVAFLVMAGLCLLAVLWSRSHPDTTLSLRQKNMWKRSPDCRVDRRIKVTGALND